MVKYSFIQPGFIGASYKLCHYSIKGHVFLFCKIRGDADEIGLPDHNLWYFNGYDLDNAFDAYFNNPTEGKEN